MVDTVCVLASRVQTFICMSEGSARDAVHGDQKTVSDQQTLGGIQSSALASLIWDLLLERQAEVYFVWQEVGLAQTSGFMLCQHTSDS